jgi:hypothetical protein
MPPGVPIHIKYVRIVDAKVIKLYMSEDIVVDKEYYNKENLSITNLTDSARYVSIESVLPCMNSTTSVLSLSVRGLVVGNVFGIVFHAGVFHESDGTIIGLSSVSWTQHFTKIDSALTHLPEMYATDVGTVLRTLLQATMLSDEYIGGAGEIIESVPSLGGSNWGGSNWGGSNWGGA